MPIVVTSNQPSSPATPAKVDAAAQEKIETKPAPEPTPLAEPIEASGASNETAIESEEKDKPSKGVQQRFDKLTKQREDARRETEFWKAEALKAKEPAQEKPPVEQAPAPVAAAGEPDPDKFESHALYLKALTRWEISESKRVDDLKASEAKRQDSQKKVINDHVDRVLKFKESATDFDQTIEAIDDILMPPLLQVEIVKSEDSGRLMYALAKNREELARICALPDDQIVRALGRFEAKLESSAKATSAEEQKPTSKAPEPISPVGNKGTGAGKKSLSDPNLSQKDYEAIRMEQIKSKPSAWG